MTTTEGMKGAGARLAARFTADPEADAFEDWTLTVVLTRR